MRPGIRIRLGALLLTIGALPASGAVAPVAAQRFTAEIRAGASVGNYTETDAGLEMIPGPAFAVGVEGRLHEAISLYGSFNRTEFGCEEGLCTGRDVTFTSQGIAVGGRWSPGLFRARAGLALQALRSRSDSEDETSDIGVGWDLGLGAEIPLGRGFGLRPGVTYLRHQAATETGDGHVAAFALELGVTAALPF